jgi:hypothetical protein
VFWVFVNTVNGDGVASPYDSWATATFQSSGDYPDTSGPGGLFLPGPGGGVPPGWVALAAAGAGACGFLWLRRRRRAREVPPHHGAVARRSIARRREAAREELRRRPGRAPRRGR